MGTGEPRVYKTSGFVAIIYQVLVGKASLMLLFPLQSPLMQVCPRSRIIFSRKKFPPLSTGPWRLSPSTHPQSCTLPPCCLSRQRQSSGHGKRRLNFYPLALFWRRGFSSLSSSLLQKVFWHRWWAVNECRVCSASALWEVNWEKPLGNAGLTEYTCVRVGSVNALGRLWIHICNIINFIASVSWTHLQPLQQPF